MAKLITNVKQLSPTPPKLRNKIVEMPWQHTNGDESVELCVWELTQREFKEMLKEAAELQEGQIPSLAWAIRDQELPAGNRIWPDTKKCVEFLDNFPWSDVQKLLIAFDEVNGQRTVSAEGNSRPTGKDDSSLNSA